MLLLVSLMDKTKLWQTQKEELTSLPLVGDLRKGLGKGIAGESKVEEVGILVRRNQGSCEK